MYVNGVCELPETRQSKETNFLVKSPKCKISLKVHADLRGCCACSGGYSRRCPDHPAELKQMQTNHCSLALQRHAMQLATAKNPVRTTMLTMLLLGNEQIVGAIHKKRRRRMWVFELCLYAKLSMRQALTRALLPTSQPTPGAC